MDISVDLFFAGEEHHNENRRKMGRLMRKVRDSSNPFELPDSQ